jgi:ubiquinone/menaquinone biosynthesis C-methylase UbiE
MNDTSRDSLLAHFYDLEYRHYDDDLAFYVQYALALDPEREWPLLELGCGTGRVMLALAEAGFRVTGVDSSDGMLKACAKHAEERDVAERVSLVKADMREPGAVPGGSFNMAFCSLNTFAYLTTTAEQLAMLNAVRRLLVQHGILILDLTPPLKHLLPPSDGEVLYQGSYHDAEQGATLHKFVSGYAEVATQTHQVRIFYDLEGNDGTLRRTTQAQVFRWTGRYEMELLLDKAGYRLEKLYGDYELGDYGDESERMIFVART